MRIYPRFLRLIGPGEWGAALATICAQWGVLPRTVMVACRSREFLEAAAAAGCLTVEHKGDTIPPPDTVQPVDSKTRLPLARDLEGSGVLMRPRI
eukprot:1176893-Prorocentrum_minimum.AAC.4